MAFKEADFLLIFEKAVFSSSSSSWHLFIFWHRKLLQISEKDYRHEINSNWTSCPRGIKSSKDLTHDVRDISGASGVSSIVYWSLIRIDLSGRMAVKKPFLLKGNRETHYTTTELKISCNSSDGVMNLNLKYFGSTYCQCVQRRLGEVQQWAM